MACMKLKAGPKSFNSFDCCRVVTIAIFMGILLFILCILTIEAYNDLPTIATKYSQMSHFPLPLISIQLTKQFNISCEFLFFDFFGNTGDICAKHVTQPIPNNSNGLWTGKFFPNGLSFPIHNQNGLKRILMKFFIIDNSIVDGDPPVFTINIFDSENATMADIMYNETTKNTYFKESSPFVTSIFRSNRYFLGRNYTHHVRMTRKVTKTIVGTFRDCFGFPETYDTLTYITTVNYVTTRNATYFKSAASGFMIDPHNFVIETQIEQRNKSALSVISNVLAVGGALLTLYVLLFGVSSIKPWGVMQKWFFKGVARDRLVKKLKLERSEPKIFSAGSRIDNDDEISLLKNELIELKEFLKYYVVNINWLEEGNGEDENGRIKKALTGLIENCKKLKELLR
ncbi:hypothetical protein Glove_37g21 [Diversispora epigaea]|uniref:Uncharacterized protein n=1 Tax=Diversispora epigaea TaxID=1348612 RepID=A0A397JMY9_9GLOM|nr:hypothetical protein Glove_37g21 [Diversispora epigaea]